MEEDVMPKELFKSIVLDSENKIKELEIQVKQLLEENN